MSTRKTKRWRLIGAVVAAVVVPAAATTLVALQLAERDPAARNTAGGVPGQRFSFSFFGTRDVSQVGTDPDDRPVEVGLRFTSRVDGSVDAIRFLRADGDTLAHPVTLWTGAGKKLAGAVSPENASPGWQSVPLPAPVPVEAGQEYVVSYQTKRYKASTDFFEEPAYAGPLSTVGSGVYAYGGGSFPNKPSKSGNYWVDVVFSSPSAPVLADGMTAGPAQARVPWEGGPGYYKRFTAAASGGWSDPSFFPIAVWYEGTYAQPEIDLDKAAGLNTYMELTEGSNLPLIRENGMHAMISGELPGYGAESAGWLLPDEVDMWGGTGKGTWTGKYPGQGEICAPKSDGCGHDILRTMDAKLPSGDGRMRHANFGKGVVFWQSDTDAAAFVNEYTDVTSADLYWYTDPNICGSASEGPRLGVKPDQCRRAANYGLTMDRMRELDAADGRRQPIYAFVEVGHPAKEDAAPTITGDQVAGAVMNSLIHEARGVIYFNHSFGGSCESQHVLRDCGKDTTRPKVTETNTRIRELAPVLNTQSYQWVFNPDLDTMLKEHDNQMYVFAMPGRTGGTGAQGLTLPATSATTAEVLFENRSVPIINGVITDRFAEEYSYHVYRIAK
ncbi:hypothetical protein Ade02nite_59400 [Paractinoplanes deccanensis]|uniref:DUF4082 domain-containing protein n=1 Tax=Paractinoplanes deccanensis TaxID=113561 RepID=A0ABQ3YBC3_9ACTN|nr:DUF4082 domain-containing protein [Actinoplanes deccanensis]GID77299.1 hypothetical protein Ade02nite_59400 [Actinoplanes deccanensis]